MNKKSNNNPIEALIKAAGFDLDDPNCFRIESAQDITRLAKLHREMIAITKNNLKKLRAFKPTVGGKKKRLEGEE